MPELATKADIDRLCRLVERQTLALTRRLGVTLIVSGLAVYLLRTTNVW